MSELMLKKVLEHADNLLSILKILCKGSVQQRIL